MLCGANGVPLNILLSGGQASEIAYAQPLLDNAYIPSLRGRPRKRCRWLLADKGYDAEALRRYCARNRMQPVIPLRTMKRKPKPGCRDCLIVPSAGSATSLSACSAG
jgi:transposase